MAEAAPNLQGHEDFWKPLPGPRLQNAPASETQRAVCADCHADLNPGARFCHVCGSKQSAFPGQALQILSDVSLTSVCDALGQTIPSLIALILGCICLLAAILVGFLFKVTTLSDWQAIQLWRIEWLLGAIALFAAALVLKRSAKTR